VILPAGQLREFGEVAPLGRRISGRIRAPLLSSRGPATLCSGFAAFGWFLGVFLGLAPLAVFGPLGAPLFLVATFFEVPLSAERYHEQGKYLNCVWQLKLVRFGGLFWPTLSY
jgi:hypothetical protein